MIDFLHGTDKGTKHRGAKKSEAIVSTGAATPCNGSSLILQESCEMAVADAILY